MACDITKERISIQKIRLIAKSSRAKATLPFSSPRKDDAFSYVLSGSCIYTLSNGERYLVQEGSLFYLSKGTDYQMEILSPTFRYYICNFSFADTDYRQCFFITPKQGSDMESLFFRLHKAFASATVSGYLSCFSFLYRIYAAAVDSFTSSYVSGTARNRIEAARQQLLSRITDPELRIPQLAEGVNMSEVYFRKLFCDLYGVTPSRYITQMRITHAQKLMTLPELRLEDIAEEAGFRSMPYFCKVFKRETGMTPAVFRKKMDK